MKVWHILKRVNFKSLWQLAVLSIQHPYHLYPTYRATKECMRISTLHFGRDHYRNTPANAFRHALWNYLIAYYCAKRGTPPAKALKWTKAITDWHENAFVNSEPARSMDFHNNEIGRMLYLEHHAENMETIMQLLLDKTNEAVQVTKAAPIPTAGGPLVFLFPTEEPKSAT